MLADQDGSVPRLDGERTADSASGLLGNRRGLSESSSHGAAVLGSRVAGGAEAPPACQRRRFLSTGRVKQQKNYQ